MGCHLCPLRLYRPTVARRTSVTPSRVAVERINGLARFAPSVSGGRKLRIARFSRSVCFSSAAALSFAVNESGAILTKTVVLLTPEEVDEAVKKKVAFRAPGR